MGHQTSLQFFTDTAKMALSCPEVIHGVVSPVTGLSSFNLNLGDTTHRLELPVGTYNYHIAGKNGECSLKVKITGKMDTHSFCCGFLVIQN